MSPKCSSTSKSVCFWRGRGLLFGRRANNTGIRFSQCNQRDDGSRGALMVAVGYDVFLGKLMFFVFVFQEGKCETTEVRIYNLKGGKNCF